MEGAAAAGAHVNSFKNLEDKIKLVVQEVRDGEREQSSSAEFNPEDYWRHLGSILKTLSLQGTRFSLAFSRSPFPTVQECEGMTTDMEKMTMELLSAFCCLPKTQGLTLHKSLQQTVVMVLDSILALVSTLAHLHPGDEERRITTGIIWQETDSFSLLPRDNKQAVRTSLHLVAGLVQDAQQEVQQIMDSGGQCEDLWGEEEDGGEAWSEQDKELAAPVKGLVKTVVKLLKKSDEAYEVKARCHCEEQVVQLDDLNDCLQCFSPIVDNLTASLYAPVNRTALLNNAMALHEAVNRMLNVLRHSHMTDDSDSHWLDFLQKANSHNLTTLTNLLNK